MRVKVFLDGDWTKDACVYYRTYLPSKGLADEGYDVIATSKNETVLWQDRPMVTRTGKMVMEPRVMGWQDPECDVAVFQRPLHRDVADLIVWCRKNGIRTVIDMDDDYSRIDPRNKAYEYAQPATSPKRNTNHLQRAIAAADVLTVTTEALADRYGRHKARVIPNFIPRSWTLQPHVPAFEPRVGWSGTVQTHPGDLDDTAGGVGRALLATGAPFHLIGAEEDRPAVQDALKLSSLTPFTASGWVPLLHYPDKMSEIDVGIVPLAPSAFNQAKSWLKGLEFSALGIPFIASPTEPYRRLNRESKLGRIAKSRASWQQNIIELVENEAMRENEGETAREIVRDRHLVENNLDLWLNAWSGL
jgi:glycosyltransferase involved in cell wall biosynthesis